MNRFSRFGIGCVLIVFLLFWSFCGVVMYFGYQGFGWKSRDALTVIIWIVIYGVAVWGVISNLRQAFRRPRDKPNTASPPDCADNATDKLTSLLGEPKQDSNDDPK